MNLDFLFLLFGLKEKVKKILPDVIKTHGLIKDKDGEIGAIMLELGNLETYLTRKSVNSLDFYELPYDQGSLFTQLLYRPNDIDLDFFDKSSFKVHLSIIIIINLFN